MQHQVIVTGPALRAINNHTVWWSREHTAKQAVRWSKGIMRAISSLRKSPERCAIAAENSEFPCELRELYFGLSGKPLHRIIFTIREQQVFIMAVRHVSQRDLRPTDVVFEN